jgi:hypothetical protein
MSMKAIRKRGALNSIVTQLIVSALSAACILATTANGSVTFTGTGPGNDFGETNNATAMFDLSISGTITSLVVTLSNTATYTPNDLPDILTGVFFTLAGNPTLTRISGALNAGSVVVENATNVVIVGNDIGGSWTYKTGLGGAPRGANQGISSAGFNLRATSSPALRSPATARSPTAAAVD